MSSIVSDWQSLTKEDRRYIVRVRDGMSKIPSEDGIREAIQSGFIIRLRPTNTVIISRKYLELEEALLGL